jgi:hypothetical protein
MEEALNRHAMTVLALHLELQQLPEPATNVVAITRSRGGQG